MDPRPDPNAPVPREALPMGKRFTFTGSLGLADVYYPDVDTLARHVHRERAGRPIRLGRCRLARSTSLRNGQCVSVNLLDQGGELIDALGYAFLDGDPRDWIERLRQALERIEPQSVGVRQ